MTLINALPSVPTDLEPLRKMSGRAGANIGEAYQSLTADMLRVSLCDANHLIGHVPIILGVLHNAGAPLSDLTAIMREANADPTIPRSAEWTAAAERLAAWADGQATPEEPAPWDDPMIMSSEDLAALVGL